MGTTRPFRRSSTTFQELRHETHEYGRLLLVRSVPGVHNLQEGAVDLAHQPRRMAGRIDAVPAAPYHQRGHTDSGEERDHRARIDGGAHHRMCALTSRGRV